MFNRLIFINKLRTTKPRPLLLSPTLLQSSRFFFSKHPINFNSTSSTTTDQFINQVRSSNFNQNHTKNKNICYLGLGSNLGNRLKNLSNAVNSLLSKSSDVVQLLDSSFVYQSQPMYLTDQPEFLNAVCKISTSLTAQGLLKFIKEIEAEQGRKLENVPRNSPRPIDIDILMFNSDAINESNLSIPHVGMLERRFVLEPLADVASQVMHPIEKRSISSLLADLDKTSRSDVRKAHLITAEGCRTLDLTGRTHLMSIVNCTPDSFSDGGRSYSFEDAINHCLEHVSAGADILDIGGMSTRPGATEVPVEEEIHRTVPLIRALREEHGVNCHISIDTFRAATAKAAVEAGATLVNDVSGGQADKDMYKTVAQLDVPYIITHMRGNSRSMNHLTSYDSGVLHGVQLELARLVQSALRSGIKRWNIIVDPGFGFAKDFKANCQLLNSLDQLQRPSIDPQELTTSRIVQSNSPDAEEETEESHFLSLNGFPLLVGLSRKSFLGHLLASKHQMNHNQSVEIPRPDQRLVPTIAASVIAILKGAHLIRAHDTKAMKQAIDSVDGIHFFGRR